MYIEKVLREEFNLSDSDFGYHESDLHVKFYGKVYEFLKEKYEYFKNITRFTSNIDGKSWLDIPFANQKYWASVEKACKQREKR